MQQDNRESEAGRAGVQRHRGGPGAARLRSATFLDGRAGLRPELAEHCVAVIADLIDEKGEACGTDIALRLGLARSTVVKALDRLQDMALVTQEPGQSVVLTGDGWKMAEDRRRRLHTVRRFLLALGVSEEQAGIDAEGIGPQVSEETLKAMRRFMASH